MDTGQREYLQKLAADDQSSFRYRRDRDRYRRTPGIRRYNPTTREIRTLQRNPLLGQPINEKTRKFEQVKGRKINVSRETLSEITKQAILPYKATNVGNFVRDQAVSTDDYITYRRGNDFIISIDDRHSPGGTDMNMSDQGTKGMKKLHGMVEAILSRHPNAAIMTTGGSIGANVVNSTASHALQRATAKTAKWASNR